MEHKVVAHFLNGRLVKGSSTSIALDRPICHVMTRDNGVVLVTLSELKALFFVKDLEGNRMYRDHQVIGPTDRRATGAKRLKITFRDREQLVALAPTYEGTRSFFYVLPADGNSNNIRILVNRKAVDSIVVLPAV
jgi:hypothetical protein